MSARARFLSLLPVLIFVPVVLAPPFNHDVAAVLSFSERWLAGEHLYSDLIDVNPPLIYVMNLLPAWLERAFGLEGAAALKLCVFALGAAAWALSWRVRDRPSEGVAERAFLDVLPGLLMVLPGYDLGQREYLMVVAGFPYLLAAARRMAGATPRFRLATAVLAACFFALKPHFLGIPALVELAVLLLRPGPWRARLLDPVPWLMAAVWLAYIASLFLLFPDYLGVVVPLVWDLYLDEGGLSLTGVMLVQELAVAELLLLPLLVAALRSRAALPRVLGLAALGGLIAAIVQHKGWSYHVLPVGMMALSLAGVLAARWLDRAGASTAPDAGPRIAAGIGALMLLYVVSNSESPWKQLDYAQSDPAILTSLLRANAEDSRVLVLSPLISPIFPALNYAHAHLTLRTMNMWLLNGAYLDCPKDASGKIERYREPWEMGRAEFFAFRTVAEDFARMPPSAVVVDTMTTLPDCGEPFSYIAYFSRHPLFAEMWSHYRLDAQWGRFQFYTRKD